MPRKYAWVWNVKPECVEEYAAMHLKPWPEIMKAHSKAGIKNYSIFQNGNQFFYEFECDGDPNAAFAAMERDPDCVRWNSITTKMLDLPPGTGELGGAIRFLPEVFYLE
jgi:L-rhamnose mutarotase